MRKSTRRTTEERLADLQKEMDAVKARAAATEARSSEHGKLFIAAVRAIDKALPAATKAKDKGARSALMDARERLGEHLAEIGVEVKPRKPRESKPTEKAEQAA